MADDRERQRAEWLAGPPPPDVIIVGDGNLAERSRTLPPVTVPEGPAWIGIGVSSGQASGTARVVRHPHEGEKLNPGEVLVAPFTDPGWTTLFLRTCAIVVETGGYLSHGAIVAREYGIPAVVNLPGLLDRVRDGSKLFVDGDTGHVVPASGEEAPEKREA